MTLTIVYDSWSEDHAVYIDGMCRGEFSEGNFDVADLVECYETYAREQPVVIERIEVDSNSIGIYDDDEGPRWPDQLGELLK